MIDDENVIRDDEGRVIIDMQVTDDTDFLSPLSKRGTQVISSDVATFLENATKTVEPNESLSLHIYSNCIYEGEKRVYANAIHRYYADNYKKVKRERQRNNILSLILFLIGVIILSVSIIVGKAGSEVWMEAIDIVAWVFCWEAVDIFIFRNRSLVIDSSRYKAMSNMKIEYYDVIENKILDDEPMAKIS